MSSAPTTTAFSSSVERVASQFSGTPINAWQFADALIRLHPEEYGADRLDGPLIGAGGERPVEEWLRRCAPLIMPAAIPQVIDGRLVLLALGRLEDGLGRVFRRTGLEALYQGGGGSALEPWARRAPARGYAERLRIRGVHTTCALSPDGRMLATGGPDGLKLWDTLTGRETLDGSGYGSILHCAFGPDGRLAFVLAAGTVAVMADGERGTVIDAPGAQTCAVSADWIVALHSDGRLQRWNPDGTQAGPPFTTHASPDATSALGTDGRILAPVADGAVLLDVSGASTPITPGEPVIGCALSPSGRHLALTLDKARALLWELTADGAWKQLWQFPGITACEFSASGDLLIATGYSGIQAIDVLTGDRRGEATGGGSGERDFAVGPGGLVALASDTGTTLWEPVTALVALPSVSPDSLDGADLLDVAADVAALADVIAARSTMPPLSIGLFADWGSGKSFLIRQVQNRVRLLSRQASDGGAHCAHVRNVNFNAWQFADANLWASLATHILDELARPERPEDWTAETNAAAQFARLERQIGPESAARERLEQAHAAAEREQARSQLAKWTFGLITKRDPDETLEQLKDLRTRLGLLLRFATVVVLALVVVVAVVVGVFGLNAVIAAVGAVGAAGAAIATGLSQLSKLLERSGPATPIAAVEKADVEAAKQREAEARREVEDLESGRRLARYAADRGGQGDYRAQLSVVSRIHDDFERMSEILRGQGRGDGGDEALPQIDRVVLYIDDLDRCPPKRVVEVLEAVHLILALDLFVVVLAVDPRWLLQSLRLHYSELLADEQQLDAEWESTPLNYLEKIIQIPFTLRPMGEGGVTALVAGLLPVQETSAGDDPRPLVAMTPATTGAETTAAAPAPASRTQAKPVASRRVTGSNPRGLLLTTDERDFAAIVARGLRTPRAVKKLTNLYRLVRARLDEESGELDAFLLSSGGDIPAYQAVLILLTVLIAFPDEAAEFLLSFGDLDPARRPDPVSWTAHQEGLKGELATFLKRATDATAKGEKTSTEPFRRWARELSRYSFETGQEVFSKVR